jgi:TBC1 domain family member 10
MSQYSTKSANIDSSIETPQQSKLHYPVFAGSTLESRRNRINTARKVSQVVPIVDETIAPSSSTTSTLEQPLSLDNSNNHSKPLESDHMNTSSQTSNEHVVIPDAVETVAVEPKQILPPQPISTSNSELNQKEQPPSSKFIPAKNDTASSILTSGVVDIRSYVPRSGASGERTPNDSHQKNATTHQDEAFSLSSFSKVIPKAPIGVSQVLQVSDEQLTSAQAKNKRDQVLLEIVRTDKWREMIRDWKSWSNPKGTKRNRLKLRCRKGIPDSMRGQAWMLLVNADSLREERPTLYNELLALPILSGPSKVAQSAISISRPPSPLASVAGSLSSLPRPLPSGANGDIVDTIERDINRTFPQYAMFNEVGGVGQTSLFRILVAYAQFDPATGYCQGMGFLAALLLAYMPEEEAWWVFLSLLQRPPHSLAGLFAPGLPKVGCLEHCLQGLMNTRLSTLSSHLHKAGIQTSMFASQWIMTLFTYSFPFPIVVRIWDPFLCEGWKVILRVALSALKGYETTLLACNGFEEILMAFKRLPSSLDADKLLDTAFNGFGSLPWKDIEALENEYWTLKEKGLETAGPKAGTWKF